MANHNLVSRLALVPNSPARNPIEAAKLKGPGVSHRFSARGGGKIRFLAQSAFSALCFALTLFALLEPVPSAQQQPPASAPVATASVSSTPAPDAVAPPAAPVVLKEGADVPLVFATAISSKTAVDDDSVNLMLAEDLKVGDVVVVKKVAPAVGTVTNAKKAGMMGRGGELSSRLEYLKSDNQRLHLRANKGKEGEGRVGATAALTVLFGPIGLIKRGKNIEIPEGAPLSAFVDQDYSLPPAK